MSMKYHLISFLLAFFVILPVSGKKLEYQMCNTEDGFLFFIMPFKIKSEIKEMKPLKADITILTNQDSIVWRISVIGPNIVDIRSVSISDNTYPTKLLYTERYRKKFWIHRVEFHMAFSDLKNIYEKEKPFNLIINTPNLDLPFRYKYCEWKKIHVKTLDFFYMVNINTKRYLQKDGETDVIG